MITFFSHFSNMTVAAMMIVLFVAFALFALWIVQRYGKSLLFLDHTDYGGIFAQAIGIVFALILAFVTVAIWQNYDRVDDDVIKEATTLNNIYRNLEAYPEPISTQSRTLIRQYVQTVIRDEWPKLSTVRENDNAHHLIARVNAVILTFNPRSNSELVLHQETMRQLSAYRGLRHDRIIGGKPNLTPPIWLTLIGGTVLYLLYLCFFSVPDIRRYALMIGALAAFLGLIYYLLVLYNYPFTEPGAISPEPFQKLLDFWKIDDLTSPAVGYGK